MKKKTIKDINVKGKRVLVRVDFNVPVGDDMKVDRREDIRLKATIPTIKYLVERKAKVILMSHLGRPEGKVVESMRMDPVAKRLHELLGMKVIKLDDCVGPEVKKAIDELPPGGIILLENVRFHPGDEANDPAFAKELASLADIFVNDAFAASHRAHASVTGVAKYLPAVAGLLLEKEVDTIDKVMKNPKKLVAVIGGAKISTKVNTLKALLPKVEYLLIGGGIANVFLKAKGYEIGKSLVEENMVSVASELLKEGGDKIKLPVDVIVADKDTLEGVQEVEVSQIPKEKASMDIGTKTSQKFCRLVNKANTVIWNGPMGLFEKKAFAGGTRTLATCIAQSETYSIVGGGDTLYAIAKFNIKKGFDHISTGGGALLTYLEGVDMPGISALNNK